MIGTHLSPSIGSETADLEALLVEVHARLWVVQLLVVLRQAVLSLFLPIDPDHGGWDRVTGWGLDHTFQDNECVAKGEAAASSTLANASEMFFQPRILGTT